MDKLIILGALILFGLAGKNLKTSKQISIVHRQGFLDGIDVSDNNGTIDWNKVAAAGVKFAWIKASEGITYKDKKFVENVQGALEVGIVPYPYHYYLPNDDPNAQAQNHLDVLSVISHEFNLSGLDLENDDAWAAAPSDPAGTRVLEYINVIESANLPVVLYMVLGFAAKWFPLAVWLDQFAKWWSHWEETTPSSAFEFWQYTDNGLVDGINGPVDLDYFNGSALP